MCRGDRGLWAPLKGLAPVSRPARKLLHALRVAYTTLILEAGANVKEAQVLARHSTPGITMNTYARTRMERLHELVESTGRLLSRDIWHGTRGEQRAASDGRRD